MASVRIFGTTNYTVKRSATSEGAPSLIASGLTSPSHSDTTGLTPGTRYYYVVSASTSTVVSNDSAEASAVPSDPIVPASVTIASFNVGDDGLGGQELSLSITNSVLGHLYQVYKSPNLGPLWEASSHIKTGNGGLLEFEDIQVQPGAFPRYFYEMEN